MRASDGVIKVNEKSLRAEGLIYLRVAVGLVRGLDCIFLGAVFSSSLLSLPFCLSLKKPKTKNKTKKLDPEVRVGGQTVDSTGCSLARFRLLLYITCGS